MLRICGAVTIMSIILRGHIPINQVSYSLPVPCIPMCISTGRITRMSMRIIMGGGGRKTAPYRGEGKEPGRGQGTRATARNQGGGKPHKREHKREETSSGKRQGAMW